MGTLDTVYKQTELVPIEQGNLLEKEAKEFERSGNYQIAKEKYIQAIDIFRLILTNRPHDISAREGIIKCWQQMACLNTEAHLYSFPNSLDKKEVDLPHNRVGLSIIKTMLVDAFVEKDWKKQCNGKYGGPKPFNISWKSFYFDNESTVDSIIDNHDKLIWAVKQGHHNLVKYLLKNKSKSLDINIVTSQQESLLELAVKYNYIEVVQLLLDHRIKVNSKGKLKWTPLHWAVYNQNLLIVQLLLKNSIRINVKEKNGLTPLHIATMKGNIEIIKYLIKRKAKINVKDDKNGIMPLHLAIYYNYADVVSLLMQYNNNLEYRDFYNRTLLHFAVANGNSKMVDLLVSKISTNTVDDMGRTPLHWAAQEGDIDIIKVLIKHNAQINIKDKFNDTPLKIAAFLGHTKEVLFLFEQGIRN